MKPKKENIEGWRFDTKSTYRTSPYSGVFESLEKAEKWYNRHGRHLENFYFGALLFPRKLILVKTYDKESQKP